MRQINFFKLVFLVFFVACSTTSNKNVIERAKVKNRYSDLNNQRICYDLYYGPAFSKKYEHLLCIGDYPGIRIGDEAEIIVQKDGSTDVELIKLRSFESFISNMHISEISYADILFFENKKLIDHSKYSQTWSELCPKDGVYCRLYADLLRLEGRLTESQKYNLLKKGCDDLDIISCFSMHARPNISHKEKKSIKRKIKNKCSQFKEQDAFIDFCSDLLHET